MNFYSPKAYEYVRSVIPLPQPSLIRKWSSVIECNPGFFKESFESLRKEALVSPEKKDCYLIIDAMAIRKQTLWDSKSDRYAGFVDYGDIPAEKPDQYASEALVFILVGARSSWKCPVGYFLTDKMTGKMQAKLVKEALIMAAAAGLHVYSVTADGTAVNFTMFSELGCKFTSSYETMVTKFKHPTQDYFVHAVLDPCHMLKLARNALAHLGSIVDCENNIIKWKLFSSLNEIQECEGFHLANKFSSRHLQFQKHKMNVQLAAQTLSASVANALEFLDKSMKLKEFQNSTGTVNFIRQVDRLFDILNSRSPIASGFKQPLRPESRNTWEEILKQSAQYLLSLKTHEPTNQVLSTHQRKTFIIGFVTTIKSTIDMTTEMYSGENPFKYVLTYKFSQDNIELLFSCIRAQGGWNNNPNCMQLKYALRKMLLKNTITASKNANCLSFSDSSTTIIPFFHSRKHKAPLKETPAENQDQSESTPEEDLLFSQLNSYGTSEFLANILFYIGGYIVFKLVQKLSCESCKTCLLCQLNPATPDHNYNAMNYNEVASASAFTLFVNNGGLRIPSQSVYKIIEFAEKIFKAKVCKEGTQISTESNLKQKMVLLVCNHFIMDAIHDPLFQDHELEARDNILEENHRASLIKLTAERYFTLRLFTYGKRFNDKVVNGQPSIRHQLTKMILFQNQ